MLELVDVHIGRFWADYAWDSGISLGRRVEENRAYVRVMQNEDQWYTALLAGAYHTVCYSTGWDARLASMANAHRIISSAKLARSSMVCWSPGEWHYKLIDIRKYYELLSNNPQPVWWMATIDDRFDQSDDIFKLPVSSRAEDAVSAALEHAELELAYSPVRDQSQDDMGGRAWRVWCVDRRQTGWMAQHTVRVIPVIVFKWELHTAQMESIDAIKADGDDYGSDHW